MIASFFYFILVLWYLLLTGYERSRSLNMVLIDPCFYKTSFCQKVFLVYHTHEFPQNLGLAMLHYLLVNFILVLVQQDFLATTFSGIYEDPSAVFKGWKKNPVNFDTVFNRSYMSFAWGSPDILSIFSNEEKEHNIHAHHYTEDIVSFSGNSNTSALDTWVFDRVKEYYLLPENQITLFNKNKIIVFLHLLGLDTAGHVYKPYSR